MQHKNLRHVHFATLRRVFAGFGLSLLIVFAGYAPVSAITPITVQNPQAGSYGLEAAKKQPPPTTGATITSPGNGSSYSTLPITVAGTCLDDLLVQVYDNGVFVGSTNCKSGSFSLQISLFSGQNDLTALVFDELDQTGPDSNTITVYYNNASFAAFGSIVTLTSPYGRRAVNPGATLSWPLVLSGGTGPYAFSIDWGDGKAADLKSQQLSGNVTITHVFDRPGLYTVTVKVTDTNGVSAFLQLIAVVNGTTTAASSSNAGGTTKIITKVLWIPALFTMLLLGPAYWLGRRSELVSLRRHLEKDMANYKEL